MSDDDDACEQTIEVFCRIRPSRRPSRMYAIAGEEQSSVTFTVPHDQSAGYINNQRETFQFPFAYVFDQDTKQDQVFDRIAAKVVDNVIAGYNGTIFAYGQTGSGKTFTITGGAEHYDDRGLIPRSISYLFDYIDRHRHEAAFTVLVSYLEIYNNCGYDLLAPDHDSKRLEDLPKITWTDDADDNDGELRLSRLKRYPATSTEEALNLLFVGDTNRVICETPMNDASSRSHCIFMLTLESRSSSTDMIRRSRLNLVDLAGSERVAKTQVSGRILVEARAINLSLHYLEQCIVALHEKAQGKRVHVPYRNSMITWVLKDSLGGNCKTVMIANISVDLPNIVESISTCRFAQRVAMIVNRATINEQVDPALVIERLKRRVQELQQQLAERCSCQNESQQQQSEVLSDESRVMIESRIVSFLNADDDMESNSLALMSRPRISYGFTHLKSLYRIRPEKLTENSDLHNLKTMVESRDSEIAILVNMLKERGMPQRPAITKHVENVGNVLQTAGLQLAPDQQDDLIERDRALQLFRQGHPLNAKIQKGIEELRVKFAEAKALGETVAGLMKEIDQTKAVLQQRRMAQAVKQISDSNRDCTDEGNEISTLCEKMMSDKSRYADAVSSLKKLKLEIEHTQRFLSNSRGKLQSEFDRQWENRENNRLDHTRHIGDSIEDSKIDADIRAFYEMSKQVKRNTVI